MFTESEIRTHTPDILRSMLLALQTKLLQEQDKSQKKLNKSHQQLEEKEACITRQNAEIASLRYQLNQQLHHRYASRSEQQGEHQLQLFDEPGIEVEKAVQETVIVSYDRKKTPYRNPLPASLPRIDVLHDLSDDEKICACGQTLHKIGEDISEQLDIVPAKVRVLKHRRCKYACRHCEEGVKMAPLPCHPLPKSMASAGTLAHVILSKYSDHLPLYRQEAMWKRMGASFPRATLSRWVLGCAKCLTPLFDVLKEELLKTDYLQVDETRFQVLKESGRTNQQLSYLWGYRSQGPPGVCVVFKYDPSRSAKVVENFLAGYRGRLQTDGYAGYHGLKSLPEVVGLGCFAHARRKFIEVARTMKKRGKSHEAVTLIARLYGIEKEAREGKYSADERYALRQAKAKPVLDEFKRWLDEAVMRVPPKSPIGQAIGYTLRQWSQLVEYIHHGDVEIDNNRMENEIRPFAVGRKNWMFAGSAEGAKASALLYSLLQTCRANNIEPYAYLKTVLGRINGCKTAEDYRALLPQHIDPEWMAGAYE